MGERDNARRTGSQRSATPVQPRGTVECRAGRDERRGAICDRAKSGTAEEQRRHPRLRRGVFDQRRDRHRRHVGAVAVESRAIGIYPALQLSYDPARATARSARSPARPARVCRVIAMAMTPMCSSFRAPKIRWRSSMSPGRGGRCRARFMAQPFKFLSTVPASNGVSPDRAGRSTGLKQPL
jgi:hypothetical protein